MDKKIVVVGGGTGLSIILRGLKKITKYITAVVTVADDGGGSGVLREDLGMLPPGDIRACLISLSEAEPLLEELINYRFTEGNLRGQSFGNLMIAAMVGVSGSFLEAVEKVGEIIAINGRVLPVTTEDIHLIAKLKNGLTVIGESKIPLEVLKNKTSIENIRLVPENPSATEDVLGAFEEADVIIVGPGSLYTSIIPNLLVDSIAREIKKSKAKVFYVANLMTQPGETDRYSISDHLEAIEKHIGENIFDYVIANNTILPKEAKDKYDIEDAVQIFLSKRDYLFLESRNISVIEGMYLEVVKNYCRHDADKIAQTIDSISDFGK